MTANESDPPQPPQVPPGKSGRNPRLGGRFDREALVIPALMGVLLALLGAYVWGTWRTVPLEGMSLDPVEHFLGVLLLAFLTGVIFLLVAGLLKVQLEAETTHQRYTPFGLKVRKYAEFAAHELGIALFVAASVSLLFEFTIRLGEQAKVEREQAAQLKEREKERKELAEEREKERKELAGQRQKEQKELADERARQREQSELEKRELKENVFQAVFGNNIDRAIIKEAVESVFQSQLTRDKVDIHCHLCCTDKDNKTTQLKVTVNYHLRNTTSKAFYLPSEPAVASKDLQHSPRSVDPHDIRAAFLNLEPGEPNTDSFLAFTESDESLSAPFVIPERCLKDARDKAMAAFAVKYDHAKQGNGSHEAPPTDDDGPWVVYDKDARFDYYYGERRHRLVIKRPLTIDPGRAVFVSFAYQVTKRHSDLIMFYSPMPTANFQISVSKGDGASDLHVRVISTHRQGIVRLSPRMQIDGQGDTYKYQIPAAVLPGQSVEVSWYPVHRESAEKHARGEQHTGS